MSLHLFCLLSLLVFLPAHTVAQPIDSPLVLREIYAQQVDRQLVIPIQEQLLYGALLSEQLQQARLSDVAAQYVLLVDRNPYVQALLLFWISTDKSFELIGASPISTGKVNGFDYFETPTGVFDHSTAHFDFRAEGTRNGFGIMGYGAKGMRVFDFGWVNARRTWDDHGSSPMRFLIHATDPDRLEPLLGTARSKGCIRIPASLNRLLDTYGILDADYERVMASGKRLWVLRPDRHRVQGAGRYLVVVDSKRGERPAWSPLPTKTVN